MKARALRLTAIAHGLRSLWNAALYPRVSLDFLSGALDPRATFSRGSNATLIGSDGTLQYAPHNLLTYSEQFDAAAWTSKVESSVNANSAVAPDGTQSADNLVESTANAIHYVTRAVSLAFSTPHTLSVYAKAAGRSWLNINFFTGTTNRETYFDLVNGVVGITNAGVVASITSVGNGWYRCSVTATTDSSGTPATLLIIGSANNISSYLGNGTSGLYVWGAQLNVGALQPYYSTTVKNLLGFSQEFNDVFWNKINSTITANVTAAPDGSVTADKLVEDTTNSTHVFFNGAAVTSIGPSTYSLYVKAAERNWVNIRHTGLSAFFNIATGQIGTVDAGLVASIVSVGNGWYRCAVVKAAGATGAIGARISTGDGMDFYTGDGTSGIFIWGTQFSDSASLDPYVYNPGAAPSNTAYYGPRFDYDPVTLAAKGLLIEEQRTNQQLYSEDLSQWGAPTNATVSNNAAVAPDGFTTADKLVEDTATSSHFLSASSITHSYVSGTLYTRSCFLKAAERFIVSVYLPGSAFPPSNRQALFNLNTGTVYSVEPNVTASIQAVGNGWYRCTITATANVTGVGHVGGSALIDNSGNGTYTGDGVSGALIWGAQMEVASFSTSYIPTVAASLTRAADVASVTGANFSSWYNAVEGTMLVGAQVANTTAVGVSGVLASIGDSATFNETLYLSRGSASTNVTANVVDNGVAQWAANTLGAAAANTVFKVAMAYKLDNLGGSFNGATPVTDNVATIPTVNILTLGNGSWSGATNWINGHIRSFKYYPTRLSNATLQSLTVVPAWTPAQLTTALWLDAADSKTITLNGSTISQWNDKSGNGRNATQGTAANQPTYNSTGLNGKPNLSFDGADFMSGLWSATTAAQATIAVVGTYASSASTQAMASLGSAVGNSGLGIGWNTTAGFNTFLWGVAEATRTGFVATPLVQIGVLSPSSVAQSLNGNTSSTAIVAAPAVSTNYQVGGISGALLLSNGSRVSEVIVLSSTASTTDRQLIEGYLAWKWGGV